MRGRTSGLAPEVFHDSSLKKSVAAAFRSSAMRSRGILALPIQQGEEEEVSLGAAQCAGKVNGARQPTAVVQEVEGG